MPIPNTIQQLRSARAAHKAWVVRAEALVNGLPLDKKHVPIVATECDFGKWYFGAGSKFQGFSSYNQIEIAHDSLHKVYAKIFKLLFEDSTSALGKIFGQAKKHKAENQQKATLLLSNLQMHYKEIMGLLDTLERDLLKKQAEDKKNQPIEKMQTKSFHDVKSMMEDLEKDVDSWLK